MRLDGRANDQIRQCTIDIDFVEAADGSCLIAMGQTKVICTASIKEEVPAFLKDTGKGWITAEYAMLPASTGQRKERDGLKKDGRNIEIQRLIGRSLRQAVNLRLLGERTIILDCDVLQADGGTRSASITGAYVALVLAIEKLLNKRTIKQSPITSQIAAISAGVVKQSTMIDLAYQEDSIARVDANIVMNEKKEYIELQGSGENSSFTKKQWNNLLELSEKAIEKLMFIQRQVLVKKHIIINTKPLLVIASANSNKIIEISKMLKEHYRVVSMTDMGFKQDIKETGSTFMENAEIKAKAIFNAIGIATLADDSGLEVTALNGKPGINSARYSGEHGDDKENNKLLLSKMRGIDNREAKFISALVLIDPTKNKTYKAKGICKGTILEQPIGEQGFGYDPLFRHVDGRNFGELALDEKNKISHRKKALINLLEQLEASK